MLNRCTHTVRSPTILSRFYIPEPLVLVLDLYQSDDDDDDDDDGDYDGDYDGGYIYEVYGE